MWSGRALEVWKAEGEEEGKEKQIRGPASSRLQK